jgi:DNA polymerase-1
MWFLHKEGIEIKGIVHDTMLMHNLLDENDKHTLKHLANLLIHKDADKWERTVDEFRTKFARAHKMPKRTVHYGFLPLEIGTPYAGSDGHYTWSLYKKFLPLIAADSALRNLYIQIESKLLWVLYDMERFGACVNREYFLEESPRMAKLMAELEDSIKKDLGSSININSVKQLVPALQKKGVRLTKVSQKTGQPSLDREVLVKLAPKYPVCQSLLDYRDLKKQKSTYIDSLAEKAAIDHKVHCRYNQNVSTGRMSGADPNLMNIPGNSDTTRSGFVPPILHTCLNCGWKDERALVIPTCPICDSKDLEWDDKYFMLFIDYSQVEVRMTAHYSQDPILLEVYNVTHEDIHTRTMCELFQKYSYGDAVNILDDFSHPKYKEIKRERKVAKMTNFLIIYGGGPKNLAVQISSPDHTYTEKECRDFINTYFQRFRGVRRWIDRAEKQAIEDQKLQNHFGRYRRLPELVDARKKLMVKSQAWKIKRALRQGVNYLIQGTCADLFKIALIRVNQVLSETRSRIAYPIHDEIVMYMHEGDLRILPTIIEEMEDFDFRVPIVASVAYSKTNWNEKRELILH